MLRFGFQCLQKGHRMLSRRPLMLFCIVMLGVAGCQQPVVGAVCDIGGATQSSASVLATPALECETRECLKVPQLSSGLPTGARPLGASEGMCTAACESDADCEAVAGSPCQSGFTCGVPQGLTVGASCCQKVCVCRDYLDLAAGQAMPTPEACNPDNPDATCCNLPGRHGDPLYPRC